MTPGGKGRERGGRVGSPQREDVDSAAGRFINTHRSYPTYKESISNPSAPTVKPARACLSPRPRLSLKPNTLRLVSSAPPRAPPSCCPTLTRTGNGTRRPAPARSASASNRAHGVCGDNPVHLEEQFVVHLQRAIRPLPRAKRPPDRFILRWFPFVSPERVRLLLPVETRVHVDHRSFDDVGGGSPDTPCSRRGARPPRSGSRARQPGRSRRRPPSVNTAGVRAPPPRAPPSRATPPLPGADRETRPSRFSPPVRVRARLGGEPRRSRAVKRRVRQRLGPGAIERTNVSFVRAEPARGEDAKRVRVRSFHEQRGGRPQSSERCAMMRSSSCL